MTYSKKSLIILLTFILLISLAANVYSFRKDESITGKEREKITAYENELLEKEKEIVTLNQQINENQTVNETDSQKDEEEVPVENVTGTEKDEKKELINTAQRFIEYAFESNPETYVTRKKMAKNYMTNNLYETLYSSDGVDEEQQKVSVEIKEIKVFADSENENEAIVSYVYNEQIISSKYEEEKIMYVKLKFNVEGNQFKVSDIEPLENEYGGI